MRHEPVEPTPMEEVLALIADAIVMMSQPGAPKSVAGDALRSNLNTAIVLAATILEDE